MCLTPSRITVKGVTEEVACRSCDLCRKNRVNDFVGRALAEGYTSAASYCLTLTYRDGTAHSATLVYSDVQKFLKRLRKKWPVRYIVAGEYGSIKGRAHWHIVLFFSETAPDWPIEPMAQIDEWPHGHVCVDRANENALRYNLKYILKDQGGQRSSSNYLAMSKKPPLGDAFFDQLADDYVNAQLVPKSYAYHVPGASRPFYLQGKSRELFYERFLEKWALRVPFPPHWTESMEAHEDMMARRYSEEYIRPYQDGSLFWDTDWFDLPAQKRLIGPNEYIFIWRVGGNLSLFIDMKGNEQWDVDPETAKRLMASSQPAPGNERPTTLAELYSQPEWHRGARQDAERYRLAKRG